jgi:transposase
MASKKSKHRGKKQIRPLQALPVIRPNTAGIDLGTTEHWVCGPAREEDSANVKIFGTTTPQLYELVDWLIAEGVESVAMESTGVYWIPVYELLESRGIEVVLVNARHLRGVPGRKTDMIDCQWIQLLHSCGLLRGSFRPAEKICALRAVQRQMGNLVEERSKAVQWMQKALDQMNVQVHRAVTDITGKTGMAIIRAIVAGQRSPKILAKLRDKRCKKSEAQIAEHLIGNWRQEHLFNLSWALRLYEHLEKMIASYQRNLIEQIEALQPKVRRNLKVKRHPNATKQKDILRRGEQPMRQALWRLCGKDLTRIDGISAGAALSVLTEVGADLSAFPDERHFVSWLRLSPKMAFSAGKALKKRRNGLGASRVAAILRMCALTLRHSKSALGACYRRTARRHSGSVAVFAVARKLAILIYRMLTYGHDYVDEGADRYEERFHQRRLQTLRFSARSLGFKLVAKAETAAA